MDENKGHNSPSRWLRAPWVWATITFLIGTAFGSGAFWEWQKAKLDAQQLQLNSAVQTTELRKEENEQYQQIIDLTGRYVKDRYLNFKHPSADLQNEMLVMNDQLKLMKDDFAALENKLARLEGRKPRHIPLDFVVPLPPVGLKAKVGQFD
jgi:hypothetical protein